MPPPRPTAERLPATPTHSGRGESDGVRVDEVLGQSLDRHVPAGVHQRSVTDHRVHIAADDVHVHGRAIPYPQASAIAARISDDLGVIGGRDDDIGPGEMPDPG